MFVVCLFHVILCHKQKEKTSKYSVYDSKYTWSHLRKWKLQFMVFLLDYYKNPLSQNFQINITISHFFWFFAFASFKFTMFSSLWSRRDQSASATFYFREKTDSEKANENVAKKSAAAQGNLVKEWMYYRALQHGESEFPLRNKQVRNSSKVNPGTCSSHCIKMGMEKFFLFHQCGLRAARLHNVLTLQSDTHTPTVR